MRNHIKQTGLHLFLQSVSHNSLIMVNISALSLAAASLLPSLCGWLSLCFLIPVFYMNKINIGKRKDSVATAFRAGFLWGIIFFSFHWYGLAHIFVTRGHAPCALLAFIFLIIYCAAHAGCWFLLAEYVPSVLAAFIYFVWMRSAVFWIFSCGGYPFAWPLLPLAHDARWLAMLPYFREEGLLLSSFLAQYFCVAALIDRRSFFLFLSCVCMVPFVWGWVMPKTAREIPAYAAQVCCANIAPCITPYALDRAQEINDALVQAQHKNPSARYVLMPESVYPWALNNDADIVQLWADNALAHGTTLIIGAYYDDHAHGCKQNGLYVITSDGIQQFYAKRVLVPFIEYMPWPWRCFPWCRALFLNGSKGFVPGCDSSLICLGNDFFCIPLVCSDLFLGSIESNQHAPLLCLANDSWFQEPSLQIRMFLFATSQAILAGRDMVYVSYTQGSWIGGSGRVLAL